MYFCHSGCISDNFVLQQFLVPQLFGWTRTGTGKRSNRQTYGWTLDRLLSGNIILDFWQSFDKSCQELGLDSSSFNLMILGQLFPTKDLKSVLCYDTGASLERVRRVHPHPLKFDNGCAAPVLRTGSWY